MKLSTDRILTTHVGSLPRPDDLVDMMMQRLDGKPVDEKAYNARVAKAVQDTVKHQVDMGFDVVNDGEMGKPSFITYAAQRLDGLEKRAGSRPSPFATSRETRDYPEFYEFEAAKQVSAPRRRALMVCTAPIKYKGHDRLKIELDDLKAAREGHERRGGLRAGDRAVEHRDDDAERALQDAPRNTCSPSPRRCARNTRRSSTRAFSCRSTIRSWSPTTSRGPTSTSPNAASGPRCASRR